MVDKIAPLHVAVIVKQTAHYQDRATRNMGCWSYPVEQFTWQFFAPGKGTTIDTEDFKGRGFDALYLEDGGIWSDFKGHEIPVLYNVIDSTLSDDHHFAPRFDQACKADLVLIDHDSLERFAACGRPVRRFLYAVNDKLFYPREKTLDVDFQCGGSPERARLRVQLSDLCKAHGWSYKSGTSSLAEYAENMGAAKVVVVQPRTPRNRPHRVYDAMSSGAAVISGALPTVSGEGLDLGYHYVDLNDLEQRLIDLLDKGWWSEYAEQGQCFAKLNTWSCRAQELREMMKSELSV